ncbi:hypothetical protein WJX84_002698 [Apatococcus fuscideae]|uniref:Mitochondrial carrier protein n=1 Tax=Apatococcus fuscideae TaxID=2026836 RepID=A0AAW1T282_9CHLO
MCLEGEAPRQPNKELGFRERIVAAGGASVVSAFVVNPLDVVKTRMQAQAAGAGLSAAAAAAAAAMPHNVLLEKFAFTACPETCPHWASTEAASAAASATLKPGGASPHIYRGTLASMRHIARTEGVSQLWRGTDMALLMAVPMVGIYMPLYDYTRGTLQPELGTSLAPLAAGALSRTAAVLCTAPLDLLRTRMQAVLKQTHLEPSVAGASAASRTSQWMEIIRHVQASSGSGTTARVGALWTGVGATLARDVPFSALYWALLEPEDMKAAGLKDRGEAEGGQPDEEYAVTKVRLLLANLVAGAVGGSAAAALTQPLDVVKTRAQLGHHGRSTSVYQALRELAQEGGIKALFTGVTPRALKAAPACAIVLASYETLKALKRLAQVVVFTGPLPSSHVLPPPFSQQQQQGHKHIASPAQPCPPLTAAAVLNVQYQSERQLDTGRNDSRQQQAPLPCEANQPHMPGQASQQQTSVACPRPIRPQARAVSCSSSGHEDHNKRRRELFMPSRLLDWPPATVQKAGRGPGNSKERQPSRLVPRQGQGPGLRDQGGQHIDQYLMRLLHVGVQNAMQDFILGPEAAESGLLASESRQPPSKIEHNPKQPEPFAQALLACQQPTERAPPQQDLDKPAGLCEREAGLCQPAPLRSRRHWVLPDRPHPSPSPASAGGI